MSIKTFMKLKDIVWIVKMEKLSVFVVRSFMFKMLNKRIINVRDVS